MDRKLFIPSTTVGYGDAFEEDLFLHLPEQMIGKEESVVAVGGYAPSCYKESQGKELTVRNVWNGIVARLVKSDFFKLRYKDEVDAEAKNISVKLKEARHITEDDIKRNRARAIEDLLNSPISNQAKGL